MSRRPPWKKPDFTGEYSVYATTPTGSEVQRKKGWDETASFVNQLMRQFEGCVDYRLVAVTTDGDEKTRVTQIGFARRYRATHPDTLESP